MTDDRKFFTDGNAYEHMMGRWSRVVGARVLDWLGAAEGLDWLDVGCGNGAFTQTLIARMAPATVVGIDPAEAQIAFARDRAGAKGAQFQVGAAEALPFGDATFDVAAMALVIGFVDDPARAVSEMARVVRPGGLVASYVWDRSGGQPAAPIRRAARELGLVGPMVRQGVDVTQSEMLQSLWEDAGLEAIECRRIGIDVSYADVDDFWRSSTALPNPTVQFLRDLTPADMELVRARLDETLPRDAAGRITFEAHTNAVKGRVAN